MRDVLGLEALGASVDVAACDVGVAGELERCLAAHRERGAPAICGVFHAAGVVQLQPLETQDAVSLRRAMAAKTTGAWRLHCLLRDQPLDCFVLFSSSAALLRSPLLGAYAGANAFLDALAHHRRARRPAGAIHQLGNVGRGWHGGSRRTPDATFPEVLARLPPRGDSRLCSSCSSKAIPRRRSCRSDWHEFAGAYPAIAADPFLEAMVAEAGRDARTWCGGSTFDGAGMRAA